MAALASGRAAGGRLLALESSDRMPLVCGLLMAALLYMPCLAAGQLDDSYSGAGQAPATQTSAAAAGAGTEPLWQRYEAMFPVPRMVPVVTRMMGHEVLYQVPDSPRATLFIAPGCSHAAHDWWPASPACPDCLGLPEELAHTQQALGRRYAVISMSSKNAHGDMCMDWPSNHKDAAAILGSFLDQQRLRHLPLYALGVSVGGGFVAKLAAHIKMDGVVSEVLGPKPVQWDLDVYQYGLPPIVFVSMDQDPPMAARISACSARLRQRGGLTATVRVAPRVVYPTFFSDRSSRLSPEVSAKVVAALHEIDMLDERGMVTVDPRHTRRPWVKQLVELVPELNGGMMADHSQVWEEMNLAWSSHEIISDFATPAFVWFEGGATADFAELVERYAAPGHMGVVGDAADAIPPPAAPIEAAAAASMPSAVQHVYEAHEARVEAAEAQAAAAAAAARVHLPAGIQKEQSAVVAAAAGIQRGSGDPTQQASAVRELGANGQQRPQLRPGLAQQQQQQQQQPAGTLVLPDQQAAGQREQASSGISAASVAAGQPLAAASSAAAATMQQGQEADAGEASPEAGAAGGPSPAAILGGVGGAAAGVALLLGIYQLARRTDGFQALPVTEPRAPGGCLLAPAEPLPLSTRLPPIPELPESPAALA